MSLDQAADASGESANDEGADRSSNEDSCFQESFANSRHASIMMVDSEPIMLDAVQSFLEIAGYRNFVKVEEPAEALENIRQHRPDVLLLDVTMPDMDGLEILGRLRENGEFTHLPVIVLASSSHTATKLQALDLGATDFLSKPIDPVEIAVRVRNTLAVRAYQDQMDWLTGLPNRSLFYDRVDWAIARARRERTKLALLHITFDDFQTVIDAFGRKVGDDVLKQLVKRLSSKFRASDAITRNAADGEGLADFFRLDKAAFSVLLPLVENVASAALVGQRVLAAMSEPLNLDGTEVRLTPSIGIAGFPEDADDAGALFKLASGACSLSAAQGGERLRFHSSTMNQDYQQWLRMEKDLRRAADNGELSLLYQPKIDVSSGVVVGAEALMRWSRPDGIFVSPSDFISVAKETGIILPIGEWSLREACRQAVQWRDQGAEIKIAVNI